jgi:hypothetical protein
MLMGPPTDGRSPETANSARSGFSIGARFLSYLSATWCGSVLFVAGVLWVSFVSLVQTYLHLYSTTRAVELAGAVAAICIGGALDFVLGVAFGRFLLRAMPPRLVGETSRPQFVLIAVSICAGLVGSFISLCSFWMPPFAVVMTRLSPSQFSSIAERNAAVIQAVFAESVFFAVLWGTGAVGPLILRHGRPRAFLDRPFVLFLRRFSTFSDRTLVALILRQAKPGVPVVFLTPTQSRPRDWDPFLVGFAGLKVLHPLRSVPMVLRAQDDDWQRAADELISRAQTILVDTSTASASLRVEAEMIDKAGRWLDTVHLRSTARSAREFLGAFGNARCIDYFKSWTGALPRLAISLAIAILTAFVITAFTVFGGSIVFFIVLSKVGVWNGQMPDVVLFSIVGFVFAVVALVSYSIFWRPAVNRNAKVELRNVLRAKHVASPVDYTVITTLDRPIKERPISIIVIAWVLFFIAVFSLLMCSLAFLTPIFATNNPALREALAKNPIPAAQYLLPFADAIVYIVSATFMLGGANWARLLYISWGAFSLVIACFTSPAKPILGIVLYLVVVFFLLRSKASAYFTQHNVRTD